jgi:hypothetical protein
LPTPQLGIVGEIEKAIKTLARTQSVKERICEYIQQEVNAARRQFSLKTEMQCWIGLYQVFDRCIDHCGGPGEFGEFTCPM